MTVAKQTVRIRHAYADCLSLARRHQRGFGNWLEQACEAAGVGERQHRRAGDHWRVTIRTAAQYFAVKWFLTCDNRKRFTWAEACGTRDDARLAYGAAGTCPAKELAKLRREYADVLAYDYSAWVSR